MACDFNIWLLQGVLCVSFGIFDYCAQKARDSRTRLLPKHIWFNEILARIPLEELGVLRCVCKGWRDAIFNSISIPNSPHLVIPVAEDTLAALDSNDQGTYSTITTNGGKDHRDNYTWKVIPLRKRLGRLCAVSEGLFCFIADRARSHAYPVLSPLVVGNPFTNRWRQLPFPLPAPVDHHPMYYKGVHKASYGAVAMATNAARGTYKVIILASSSCNDCLAFEFDSSSSSPAWAVYQQVLPDAIPGECFSATIVNGKAYYIGHSGDMCTLVAYDLTFHTWTRILSFSLSSIRQYLLQQTCKSCNYDILMSGRMHPPTALLWPANNDGTKLLVVGSIGCTLGWAYWVLNLDVPPTHGTSTTYVEHVFVDDEKLAHIEMGADKNGAAVGTCYDSDTNTLWFVFNNQFTSRTKVVAYDVHTHSSNLIQLGPPLPINRRCYLFFRGTVFNRGYHTPLLWTAPL